MLAAAQQVECTNCGDVGPAFWITLGALLIAAIALYFSFSQHRELLRRLRARARFKIIVKPQGADADGVIRTEGNAGTFRVGIEIKNEGDLAARETLINVLFPRGWKMEWCGPNGEPLDPTEAHSRIARAGEGDLVIDREEGKKFEADYLSRMLPRVGTRPHHALFFQTYVDLPDEGEIRIPVKVKVQADEIPEQIEEYIEELVVRIQGNTTARSGSLL